MVNTVTVADVERWRGEVSRVDAPGALRLAGPFTADLSQAAATYDLCTATGGDVALEKVVLYVTVAGATFTTVAFAPRKLSVSVPAEIEMVETMRDSAFVSR